MTEIDSIANEAGVSLLEILSLVKSKNLELRVTPNQDELQQIYGELSGFYNLTGVEQANLWNLISSDQGQTIIKKYSPFLPHLGEDAFTEFISEKLFDYMGDELKSKIDQSVSKKTIETVLGVGLLKVMYSPSTQYPTTPLKAPKELLQFRPDLPQTWIEKSFRKLISTSTTSDYDSMIESIAGHKTKLMFEIDDTDFVDLEIMIHDEVNRANRIVEFKRRIDEQSSETDLKLKWHQAVRLYNTTIQNDDGSFEMYRTKIGDCTSGGKTFPIIGTYGILRQIYTRQNRKVLEAGKGKIRGTKGLIIAPLQTIHSVYDKKVETPDGTTRFDINKYMHALNLVDSSVLVVRNLDDAEKIGDPNYDLVMINMEKLSLLPDVTYSTEEKEQVEQDMILSNEYIAKILENFDRFCFGCVDESHNFLNISSKRNRSFSDIIEATKRDDFHFILSSATFFPHKVEQTGYQLFMSNPRKYSHYKDNHYVPSEDPFSLFNEVNARNHFDFDVTMLQKVFGLGPLPHAVMEDIDDRSWLLEEIQSLGLKISQEQYPHVYDMDKGTALEYFQKWKDPSIANKWLALSETLLKGSIPYIKQMITEIKEKDPSAQFTVYSHLQSCFVDPLLEQLQSVGLKVGKINGTESVVAREDTAQEYSKGNLDVVTVQRQVGQSFSLITHDRNNYVIQAEPTTEIGKFDQNNGRGYRTGQFGDTLVYNLIPHSEFLRNLMIEFVAEAAKEGVYCRKTFQPSNVYEDMFVKMLQRSAEVKSAQVLSRDSDKYRIAAATGSEFPSLSIPKALERARKGDADDLRQYFSGFQKVRGFYGQDVVDMTESLNGQCLLKGYSVKYLITRTTVGQTANLISKIIDIVEEIEKEDHPDYHIKHVLDVGAGTLCFKRFSELKKTGRNIISLDVWDEMLKKGHYLLDQEGNAKEEYYVKDHPITRKTLDTIAASHDISIESLAQKIPLEDGSIDFYTSSYALMYNQQGFNGEKDGNIQSKRDIEEIIIEANRVLRDDGYGLIVLPGKSTHKEHQDMYDKMLDAYGFDVLVNHTVTSDNFSGANVILFRKENAVHELQDFDEPVVFSYYKLLIGGGKKRRNNRPRMLSEPEVVGDNEFVVNETTFTRRGNPHYNSLGSIGKYIKEKVIK